MYSNALGKIALEALRHQKELAALVRSNNKTSVQAFIGEHTRAKIEALPKVIPEMTTSQVAEYDKKQQQDIENQKIAQIKRERKAEKLRNQTK